ncbi:cytochrome P450 [Peterkaempfera bronchialis]|uniref:cytochrome P450 n=1 Tax=Peterkaempfera bronchialis TaxID=2126346 RepID=UPI003C2E4A15
MTAPAPPPGCPAHAAPPAPVVGSTGLTPLYGEAFAADPASTYALLRGWGHAAPVEIAPGVEAVLVTSYHAALAVLRTPAVFVKDSRRWQALTQGRVPPDSPVLPMMAWRPSCLFADGVEHARLRTAITDSLSRIDAHALRTYADRAADALIDRFAPAGRADLVADYAALLPLLVFARLFGAPESMVHRMVYGAAGMIDASGPHAEQASADLLRVLAELVALKRAAPGPDLTSWLLTHPASLTDQEMLHQLVVVIGAGTVPQTAWTANSLLLLLTDDRFGGSLAQGSRSVHDALEEVLWEQSPMSNFSVHYAVRDVDLDGTPIPAGVPILISHHAANTSPLLAEHDTFGNHAHLAWSAGPHRCPAQAPSTTIAVSAIDRLLDRLPDLALAIPAQQITWRPGPFHRCPDQLPVTFPAEPTPAPGGTPWTSPAARSSSTPPAPASTPRPPASAPRTRRSASSSPARWWPGRSPATTSSSGS